MRTNIVRRVFGCSCSESCLEASEHANREIPSNFRSVFAKSILHSVVRWVFGCSESPPPPPVFGFGKRARACSGRTVFVRTLGGGGGAHPHGGWGPTPAPGPEALRARFLRCSRHGVPAAVRAAPHEDAGPPERSEVCGCGDGRAARVRADLRADRVMHNLTNLFYNILPQ